MTTGIAESIGTIIGVALVFVAKEFYGIYKTKSNNKKKATRFVNSIDISVEINKLLNELRVLVGANSTHILGYHNGTVSFNGISFQFISMQYEATDGIIRPNINDYQNVPAGQFSQVMADIHHNGFTYVDWDDDTNIGHLHKQIGVKSSYKFRIGDSIARGSVSISYYGIEHKLTEKQKQIVNDYLIKINGLIEKL